MPRRVASNVALSFGGFIFHEIMNLRLFPDCPLTTLFPKRNSGFMDQYFSLFCLLLSWVK